MEIGVVAAKHSEFLAWVHDECRLPSSLHRASRNIFTTPSMTIRYITSPHSARGVTFNLIVLTGRYADKWSDADIALLHHHLR